MSALHFTELHVRRAPGCASGWPLRNLSPGINVIAGPNASGKTTTARAIAAVLWPSTAAPYGEIAASFSIGNAAWHAELHGNHAAYQRDGAPGERPQLPAAETMSDRYHVALHDLLQTSDDELGKAILLEAAGDYDLDAAYKALGFTDNSRLARSLRENFGSAQDEVRRIEQELGELGNQSARLEDLSNGIQEARTAIGQAELLNQAIEKHGHAAAYAEAAGVLTGFDLRLNKLVGNELEQLIKKQDDLTKLSRDQENARCAIDAASTDITACILPEDGVPTAQLAELSGRIQKLRDLDGIIERLSDNLVTAQIRESDARQALGAVGDSGMADLPTLNEIAEFVINWDEALAAEAAALRWREWLDIPIKTEDISALHEAAIVLAQWLRSPMRSPASPGWFRVALLVIAGGIMLGGGLLALKVTPFAWLGMLPAAALVIIAFIREREAASSASLFPDTRIAPPREWTLEAVQERLDEIHRQLAQKQLAEERHREIDATEQAWQRIVAARAEVEDQRTVLCVRLGCKIDPRLFSTFIEQSVELRRSHVEVVEIDKKIKHYESARDHELDGIGMIIAPFSIKRPSDLAAAIGCAADLGDRDRRWHEAQRNANTHQRECERILKEYVQIEGEIAKILEFAQVSDAASLSTLIVQLDDFRKAQDMERTRRGLRDGAVAFFQLHTGLANRADGELDRERDEALGLGTQLEALVAEKAKIEERINSAKQRNALEAAVTRRENERRSLVDIRNTKIELLAGHLVTDYVRTQMGDVAMPPVFDRGRELFARFTSHAWELMPPDDAGQFRARDTIAGGMARPLGELSSGTRVQLLLAMRTAFVAEQERGLQLPLLLDETLANSDDQRAQQIIDAIAELALDGRQIFYFTAQTDEVAKWREFFSRNADVPHHVADLAAARGEEPTAKFDRIAAPPIMAAPLPGEHTYEEYGMLLGVPQFDPSKPVASTHLWHLLEDAATLHRLLEMGFEHWGQVDYVLRSNGGKLVGIDVERVQANARLIGEICQCWQHGRGKALVREALTEAGVTGNFIERVWELACNLEHDAQRLIEALNHGVISRLRETTIERLREYCEENGYVSSEVPLDGAVIRGRLHALAGHLGVESARVEALLAKIWV